MVGTRSFEDDDFDDMAAMDFSVAETEPEGSVYDAFSAFEAPAVPEAGNAAAADDAPQAELFSVTNPPGTVTVTTLMDGRVHRIELAPAAVASTEAELAEEIVVIAGLATQQAKSAQFTYMLEGMRREGQDDVVTRDFLKRDLDLPSPEEADAAQARVFATRYAGEHD